MRGGRQSITTGLQKNLLYVRNTGPRTCAGRCFVMRRGATAAGRHVAHSGTAAYNTGQLNEGGEGECHE